MQYKTIVVTMDCNISRKGSNHVLYNAYGIKETNFNLCCGENLDTMSLLLLLGFLGCYCKYDVPLLWLTLPAVHQTLDQYYPEVHPSHNQRC